MVSVDALVVVVVAAAAVVGVVVGVVVVVVVVNALNGLGRRSTFLRLGVTEGARPKGAQSRRAAAWRFKEPADLLQRLPLQDAGVSR